MSQEASLDRRKLVAVLACRNTGSRLYGKPLQNLDVDKQITILDNIINCLETVACIDAIVLGIASGSGNLTFLDVARRRGLPFIIGDEEDVLSRLVEGARASGASDVFRITSESPFPLFAEIDDAWESHTRNNFDATFLDSVIDGCNFEILSTRALERAHTLGDERHRSELCSLYIRENELEFRVGYVRPPESLIRRDLRLTVDNPEDLVLCRAVFRSLEDLAPRIPIESIVEFLDSRPDLVSLCSPYLNVPLQGGEAR